MNETKFTPGPWNIGYGKTVESVGSNDFFGIGFKTDHDWTAICLLSQADRVSNIDEANAHLIAAAPDLYDALENLEPYLDAIVCYASTITEHPPNGFILKARAALAKARGEG